MSQPDVYAAVEAGGTKFICVIASRGGAILAEHTIPTTQPEQTLGDVARFFSFASRMFGKPVGVGIAGFGPLQIHPAHPDWGRLLRTPKPGWSGVSLVEPIQRCLPGCSIEIDTDVNAAALAEATLERREFGAGLVYITVGTGIGGGAVLHGEPVRGALHPEMGHIHLRRDERDLTFAGCCPFHADCAEGLASGTAIRQRWNRELGELDAEHPARSIIGGYLGQLAATISLMLSPDHIVFGGGVMHTPGLLSHLRAGMRNALNGYLPAPHGRSAIEECVSISRQLGRSGLLGALQLAQRAAQTARCTEAARAISAQGCTDTS